MANILEETLAGSLDSVSATFVTGAGVHNVSVSGTFVGSVYLERSFDAGSTWLVRRIFADSDPIQTAMDREIEGNVSYRFRFAVFTSGTPIVRIAQGSNF